MTCGADRAGVDHRQVAADDDFVLQTVTLFKKVREEYVHKCRENKWVKHVSLNEGAVCLS